MQDRNVIGRNALPALDLLVGFEAAARVRRDLERLLPTAFPVQPQ